MQKQASKGFFGTLNKMKKGVEKYFNSVLEDR